MHNATSNTLQPGTKTKRPPTPRKRRKDLVVAYCTIWDHAMSLNLEVDELYGQVASGMIPEEDNDNCVHINPDMLQEACGEFTAAALDTGIEVDRIFEAISDAIKATAAANEAMSDAEWLLGS